MTTGMTSSEPRQGEIWWVQFSPTIGDEIRKIRPAVIISADGLEGLKLRLVVPLTGWKASFVRFYWMVQIPPTPPNGLTKLSTANPLQARSVSLERFAERLGVLEDGKLEVEISESSAKTRGNC